MTARGSSQLATRIAVAVLGLAAVVAGCSDDPAEDVSSSGQPAEQAGVAALEGQSVTVGYALTGDRLPLIAEGTEATPSSVALFDTATQETRTLPELPGRPWFTSSYALATERWVVVSTGTCPQPPIEEDTGPACPDGQGTAAFFAFDLEDERWTQGAYPENEGDVAEVDNIVGDVATVVLRDPMAEGRATLGEVDLASDGASLRRVGDEELPPTCTSAEPPAARFDAAEGAAAVTLSTPGSAEQQTIEIPRTALPTDGLRGPYCFSAGQLLLTVPSGVEDAPDPPSDDPDAPLPDEEPTYSTPWSLFAPLRGGEPILEGDGTVTALTASTEVFAVTTTDELVVGRPDGTVVDRREASGRVAARAVGAAVVLVTLGDGATARSIEVVGR